MSENENGKPHGSASRYSQKSLDELREAVNAMHGFTGSLDAVIVTAEELGLETLRIDGATKMDRAIEMINAFVEATENAVIDARRGL